MNTLRLFAAVLILWGSLYIPSPKSRAMDSLTWPGVFRRSGDYVLFGGCGAGWDLWQGNAFDRDGKAIQVPGDDAVYMLGNVNVAELAETEEDGKLVNYVAIEPIETDYGIIKWALLGDHPLWPATDEEAAECRQQEAALAAPIAVAPPPTATVTPTPAPTETPSPADVRITDFTLSAETWVSDFSSLQEPVVLRANRLWVQVTNVGGLPYVAPSGGGQYTLQVMLNKAGQQLDGYAYAPGHPDELEALPDLQPGASYVLRVDGLFFWTPVTEAQLYVLLKPDPGLNFRDSILAKPVSVQPSPNSDCACVAGVVRNMFDIVAERYGTSPLDTIGLGATLEKQGCQYPQKMIAEVAGWLVDQSIDLAPGPLGIEDLGRVSGLALDVAAEAQRQELSCLSVVDWVSAVAHELLVRGLPVDAVAAGSQAAEWPGDTLVVNSADQRCGCLEDGQVVQEILGSRAAVFGDQCVILYPSDEVTQVRIVGRAAGDITLYAILAQNTGSAMSLSYRSVPLEEGMVASLDSEDREFRLQIDVHGDGQVLQTRMPDQVRRMTQDGAILAQPGPTPTATLEPTAPPTRPLPTATLTPVSRSLGASIFKNWPLWAGVFALVIVLAIVGFVLRARRAQVR